MSGRQRNIDDPLCAHFVALAAGRRLGVDGRAPEGCPNSLQNPGGAMSLRVENPELRPVPHESAFRDDRRLVEDNRLKRLAAAVFVVKIPG